MVGKGKIEIGRKDKLSLHAARRTLDEVTNKTLRR